MELDHLDLQVGTLRRAAGSTERHFGFRSAFDPDGGHFLRIGAGFLLAVVPAEPHHRFPPDFHDLPGFPRSLRVP